MEVWQMALFGVAAAVALRSLAGQMTRHKSQYMNRQVAEIERQRRIEHARLKKLEKEKARAARPKRANGAAA